MKHGGFKIFLLDGSNGTTLEEIDLPCKRLLFDKFVILRIGVTNVLRIIPFFLDTKDVRCAPIAGE